MKMITYPNVTIIKEKTRRIAIIPIHTSLETKETINKVLFAKLLTDIPNNETIVNFNNKSDNYKIITNRSKTKGVIYSEINLTDTALEMLSLLVEKKNINLNRAFEAYKTINNNQ